MATAFFGHRGTHLRRYAMATKAGLEIGPSTIFDARPSLVEPTVMHLGRILEEHSKAGPLAAPPLGLGGALAGV